MWTKTKQSQGKIHFSTTAGIVYNTYKHPVIVDNNEFKEPIHLGEDQYIYVFNNEGSNNSISFPHEFWCVGPTLAARGCRCSGFGDQREVSVRSIRRRDLLPRFNSGLFFKPPPGCFVPAIGPEDPCGSPRIDPAIQCLITLPQLLPFLARISALVAHSDQLLGHQLLEPFRVDPVG